MVPDKATGIAKGSAFVFVAGKKVHAHPTREPVKNVKPVELLVVTNLQNAERLILLLHECVACPDAPQVGSVCCICSLWLR